MLADSALAELFGPSGPLAHAIPGFKPRAVQALMAEEVEAAFSAGDLRLIEAGTGTGKTFAYLVPALVSGRRIIVSTGTKNLQDQLFERDLPRLLHVLRVPARTAMLKGRSNYLCLYRMKRAGQDGLTGPVRAMRTADERLAQIEHWSRSTERGEVAELGRVVEDERLRFQITSTADNCLGAKCPDFGNCFVARARRNAMAADLVVVNHHVLLADVLLKEEGFGEILPGADAVIVDEAHQLPELAGQFFGLRVSTRQMRDLADDTSKAAAEQGDVPELREAALAMASPVIQLEARFGQLAGRVTAGEFLDRMAARGIVETCATTLAQLADSLHASRERSAALESLDARAARLRTRLTTCLASSDAESGEAGEYVRWVEAQGRGGALHATPLDLGEGFARVFAAHPGAWVLTSATLSASGDFRHFQAQLGAPEAPALALESPFDYATQARLHLPEGLPEPSASDYPDRVAELSQTLIEASGGGAFVLCTSHRALRLIAQRLRERTRHPLFVQGDDDRSRLVERFAASGDGVLVGTQSFWEGVDVKGRALRLVIIDKLPFASPGDPVYDARLEALRRRGGNPFVDVQLPEAIVNLRQGAGRLIRDETDRGLLVLCDPRLRTKSYGRKLLSALPVMPRVDLDGARDWLSTL
ncbi:MAG: ATP-dependent DNA helicase [Panacagrimonas sp.]